MVADVHGQFRVQVDHGLRVLLHRLRVARAFYRYFGLDIIDVVAALDGVAFFVKIKKYLVENQSSLKSPPLIDLNIIGERRRQTPVRVLLRIESVAGIDSSRRYRKQSPSIWGFSP